MSEVGVANSFKATKVTVGACFKLARSEVEIENSLLLLYARLQSY